MSTEPTTGGEDSTADVSQPEATESTDQVAPALAEASVDHDAAALAKQQAKAQAEEHAAAVTAAKAAADAEEIQGLKMLMLDSAELATRSANLAVGAGENMKNAAKHLETLMQAQKKQTMVLLSVASGLMVIAATIFITMTFSLKSKINQIDPMVNAISKRVLELDESMEMVGSVNEGLQAMVANQDALAKKQTNLEARLEEAIKNAESVPEKTAQQVGAKGELLAAQVKSLEGRFAAQSRALNAMANQMNGLQGTIGETGGFKKELETLAKLQRERQAADNALAAKSAAQAAAATNASNAAAIAAAKQREKMIQYPRAQQEVTPAGTAGILSKTP